METILLGSLFTIGYVLDSNDCSDSVKKKTKIRLKKANKDNNQLNEEKELNSNIEKKNEVVKKIKLKKKDKVVRIEEPQASDNIVNYSDINLEDVKNTTIENNVSDLKPFYGSKMTQNMNLDYDNRKLHLFTGSKELNLKQPKKEVETFTSTGEKQNIYGGQVYTDAYQSQLNKSRYMTNHLPFVQKKVAPGIGIGVDGTSQKGFHPDTREYELPKTVDDLRAKNNQKVSYKARMNKGKSIVNKRDAEYNFTKYKNPAMFVERPLEATGGNVKKKAMRGTVILNDNKRSKFFGELKGGLKGTNKTEYRSEYQESNRKQNNQVDTNRNVKLDNKFDINKDSYNFPVTKKEIQSMLQYDKELHVGNFLEALLPIRHYEDKAKQTVKETTIHYDDKNILNLKSNQKEQKYFDDKARQTVKETTIHYDDKNILNLKSHQKEQKYFDDKARQTIKETTIHNIKDVLNIKLFNKLPSRIKHTIAKTLKEYVLHTPRLGNVILEKNIGDNRVDIPELVTTLKETLLKDAPFMNLLGAIKHKMYLNDDARTTHKETYSDKNRIGTAIFNLSDGYKSANYDMKETNKQNTCDNDYIGIGNYENTDGYKTANFDMKETNKQNTSNNDYFGTSQGYNESMSYEDVYNATINDIKEKTLVGRKPTFQGAKKSISSDNINLENSKKIEHKIDRDTTPSNINNASLPIRSLTEKDDIKRKKNDAYYLQTTSNKNDSINDIIEANNNRDTELLVKQLRTNPYAISVNSVEKK